MKTSRMWMRGALAIIVTALGVPIGVAQPAQAAQPTGKALTFTAEIWADNWFALYANGKKVGEDSVPITTERSFNSQRVTFTATYPLTIGIIGKDFTENASGLEYIGTPKQQIGDGGLIAQIRDNRTGTVIAATDGSWKSFVVNRAPLNPECEASTSPLTDCRSSTVRTSKNWSSAGASNKGWTNATVYTPQEVGVKDGYSQIAWDPSAKLVWGDDLKLDNEVLLRTTIATP